MNSNKEKIIDPISFSPKGIKAVLDTNNAIGFNIPIYQRLYAWSDKEVGKLLEDIKTACEADKEKDYYVGNLTLNFNIGSKRYDIIDGQQRMTTIWLIALFLRAKTGNNAYSSFLKSEKGVLLNFVARQTDVDFLKKLLEEKDIEQLELLVGENINQRMINAIKCTRDFLSKEVKDLGAFSTYFLSKVKLVAVFLPNSIDLNKYFEDMNNRGLQLEPHHILKAQLIENIDKDKQLNYAKVWDAVSQMNQYVEYGLVGTLKENRKKILEKHNYFDASSDNQGEQIDLSLRNIVEKALETEYRKVDNKPSKDPDEKAVSIVTFPEFLLHCLRLHKGDESISIDDKKLLDSFKPLLEEIKGNQSLAMGFIKFLFERRIEFDRCFIKSVVTSEESRWEIRDISKKENEDDYERKKHLDGNITQIQAMLNVSTSSSLWLTKAMKVVKDKREIDESYFFQTLEKIDTEIHPNLPFYKDLNNGTSTNRYWFYKLDYLLWQKWSCEETEDYPQIEGVDNLKSKIRNFQFRDNRSVEHIHPQNPAIETWFPKNTNLEAVKNQLGNLALISIRSNSSYNNQTFSDKKDDFKKRTKNWGVESLKLVSVYSNNEWTIDIMNEHQELMIKLLCQNYNQNYQEYAKSNE